MSVRFRFEGMLFHPRRLQAKVRDADLIDFSSLMTCQNNPIEISMNEGMDRGAQTRGSIKICTSKYLVYKRYSSEKLLVACKSAYLGSKAR